MTEREVLEASLEAGRRLWLRAEGNPASIVAYGVAGATVAAGVFIGLNAKKSIKSLKERRRGNND